MRGFALGLAVSVAAVSTAVAQDFAVPARLTLEEAVRIAEARSPLMASAGAATAFAEAEAMAAAKRPNPVFSISSEGLPFSQESRPPFIDNQQISLVVEQDIETGGRRGLRDRAARSSVEAARADGLASLRLLRLDVRRAYLQAALAAADHDVATATLADLDRVLAINRARFEQGELSGIEMRRLQVERHRFNDDVLTADLALKNARAVLLSLMNARPLDQPFEAVDTLNGPIVEPAAGPAERAQAFRIRPDLEASRRRAERIETESALERALRHPVWTIGGGYQRDFGTNALVLLARMPLPFANRNEGGIARADAERRLASSASDAATTAAALEIQLAVNGVAANRARVQYVEGDYLRNAREARDIVLASYRAGAATLIDYLDAQRALGEAQRVQNRALYDYRVSVCQLEAALGMESPASGVRE